jgi:uncharacterized protein (DUF305 family)
MRRAVSLAIGGAVVLSAIAAGAEESGFEASIGLAMEKMHRGMAIPPSGDPDRDFARMMIAHHQGAIDMAEAELQYGSNQRLRRLAQGILVEQQQEIAVMNAVLAETSADDSQLKPEPVK